MSSTKDHQSTDRYNNTPLMVAAEHENRSTIQLLLEGGADVNQAGYNGNTPLHIAVDVAIDGNIQANGEPGNESTECIELLLKHGADPRKKNNSGETPIDWARAYTYDHIVTLLEQSV